MIGQSSSTIQPAKIQQPVETQEHSVSRGYLWLTRGIALLLLFAAGMKAWQLATVPVLGEGLLHARWLNTLIVEFELFWAVWLLYGLYPKGTHKATLALFTLFAGVSFYKALSGEASCNCFGAAQGLFSKPCFLLMPCSENILKTRRCRLEACVPRRFSELPTSESVVDDESGYRNCGGPSLAEAKTLFRPNSGNDAGNKAYYISNPVLGCNRRPDNLGNGLGHVE